VFSGRTAPTYDFAVRHRLYYKWQQNSRTSDASHFRKDHSRAHFEHSLPSTAGQVLRREQEGVRREPCILPSMSSEETKYIHHSLNIDPVLKAVADEVAEKAGIQIEFKAPLWTATKGVENYPDNLVGIFCETARDAELFCVAFAIRRWEDRKSIGE
jgi:hypothetical protein